ncbi:hypothetical protein DIPPA_04109 [Diplonema papillatum]|nr:hypothetical protein DIPPA_34395 [Diplonema papillatum]KAJ9436610.1 hypothetical protein DIPPA_06588 [Diplonema papillatum]KAJ9437242.1 hypothetical protein DIPPA_04109 [Diplonema papillatum]
MPNAYQPVEEWSDTSDEFKEKDEDEEISDEEGNEDEEKSENSEEEGEEDEEKSGNSAKRRKTGPAATGGDEADAALPLATAFQKAARGEPAAEPPVGGLDPLRAVVYKKKDRVEPVPLPAGWAPKVDGFYAAPLINSITAKKGWPEKIKDAVILAKWRSEYRAAIAAVAIPKHEGKLDPEAADRIFAQTIDCLLRQTSFKISLEFCDDAKFVDWPVKLELPTNDIFPDCQCDCTMCNDGRFVTFHDDWYEDNNYPGPRERTEKAARQARLFCKLRCKCYLPKTKRLKRFRMLRQNALKAKTALVDEADVFPPGVADQMRNAVAGLISGAPPAERDWHPGSNQQVLDLVHPSLYCALPSGGKAKSGTYPTGFHWVPTTFEVTSEAVSAPKDGQPSRKYGKPVPLGPVNNLADPTAVDAVCSELQHMLPYFNELVRKSVLPYTNDEEAAGVAKKNPNSVLFGKEDAAGPNLPKQLKQQFQVIVKVASIELTPEKPAFKGGHWHLEGVPAERIVATGIHYLGTENVTDSALNFRMAYEAPGYPQCGYEFCKYHYNMPQVQSDDMDSCFGGEVDLGALPTKGKTCLFFPNNLQHRVDPFGLVDGAKPGFRRFLVIWLVDPLHDFTQDTTDVDLKQGKITLAEAKAYRELLMHERKYMVRDNNIVFERHFSLCEH